MLKVMGGWPIRLYACPSQPYAWPSQLYGGGLQHFSVSPRPLLTNRDFELGLTELGLGLGGSVSQVGGQGLTIILEVPK